MYSVFPDIITAAVWIWVLLWRLHNFSINSGVWSCIKMKGSFSQHSILRSLAICECKNLLNGPRHAGLLPPRVPRRCCVVAASCVIRRQQQDFPSYSPHHAAWPRTKGKREEQWRKIYCEAFRASEDARHIPNGRRLLLPTVISLCG